MDNDHNVTPPNNDNILKIDDSVGHVVEEKKDVVSTIGQSIEKPGKIYFQKKKSFFFF